MHPESPPPPPPSSSLLKNSLQTLTTALHASPYDARLYLRRAECYEKADELGEYPDLAAGDAYKALLLTDEAGDEGGEFHAQASAALRDEGEGGGEDESEGEGRSEGRARKEGDCSLSSTTLLLRDLVGRAYLLLSRNLVRCGSLRSAFEFCQRGLEVEGSDDGGGGHGDEGQGGGRSGKAREELKEIERQLLSKCVTDKPLQELKDGGNVRRELYPWNTFEPDRSSEANLAFLNEELSRINAHKVSAQVVDLPDLQQQQSLTGLGSLSISEEEQQSKVQQLGLVATSDIDAGEVLLEEYSLLTANNRLHDPLCDACSKELVVETSLPCPECETAIFCSSACCEAATAQYHPAVCGTDVDSVGRDVEAKEAADALYLLLVGRTMALAETQDVHPLDLKEIRFLWGDFAGSLPFTFKFNILYPLNILEKMDIDIFQTLPRYDFWILNTLFAKFRGVASGRVDPRTGRPEVCAVHPLWCLANHSCAPDVKWEWDGSIKFWARSSEELVRWGDDGTANTATKATTGIKAGEQIMNHYCDVDLDVKSRREWARGALGGDCLCPRCVWEEKEERKESKEEEKLP